MSYFTPPTICRLLYRVNINTQPIAPVAQESSALLVHSVWYTIQGEGPFSGVPAVFIRLAGCNLCCPFCDTDYTSAEHTYALGNPLTVEPGQRHVQDLMREVRRLFRARPSWVLNRRSLVVVTGGEPFRQNIRALTSHLVLSGFLVQVETNGTLFQSVHPNVVVVCSPKTPKIHNLLAHRANAYKYVLEAGHIDPSDGLPAGTLGKYATTARPPPNWEGDIFVQPLDTGSAEQNAANLQACVQSSLAFGYRLCLQVHKLANLP